MEIYLLPTEGFVAPPLLPRLRDFLFTGILAAVGT